jgi:tetratricopeptide (TPR) repeat protein
MEAVVFIVFFGLYIFIRVLFGGGESAWEKQSQLYKDGIHLFKIKEIVSARLYFENTLRKRPYDSINHVFLGEIALLQKEPERALFYAQKALRLDNTIWQAHLLMSKAFYEIPNPDEAFKNAKNAVWFGRNSAETNLWFGKLLVEKGDIEAGLHHLTEAYRLGDEDAGPYLKNRRFLSNS